MFLITFIILIDFDIVMKTDLLFNNNYAETSSMAYKSNSLSIYSIPFKPSCWYM